VRKLAFAIVPNSSVFGVPLVDSKVNCTSKLLHSRSRSLATDALSVTGNNVTDGASVTNCSEGENANEAGHD
jgi:hypothetical protein